MSNDKYIKKDNLENAAVADNARFFWLIDKDYEDGLEKPFAANLVLCDDTGNPWSCSKNSPRANLTRIIALLDMHPGYIFIAPEIIGGRGWPDKHLLPSDLAQDGESFLQDVVVNHTTVMLETLHALPEADRARIVVQMGNEDWTKDHPGFVNSKNAFFEDAYIGYRAAHDNEVCVGVSMSAVHVRVRSSAKDSVLDYDTSTFDFLEQFDGWLDVHPYPIDSGKFAAEKDVLTHPDFVDAIELAKWLRAEHPGIKLFAGELGYTSSLKDELPTDEQRQLDVNTLMLMTDRLLDYLWLVIVYQYRDHSKLEPLFGGTGIFPHVNEVLERYAKEAVSLTPLPEFSTANPPLLLERLSQNSVA
jgi:hypothetical protein